jgi:hypothetical protein
VPWVLICVIAYVASHVVAFQLGARSPRQTRYGTWRGDVYTYTFRVGDSPDERRRASWSLIGARRTVHLASYRDGGEFGSSDRSTVPVGTHNMGEILGCSDPTNRSNHSDSVMIR